MPVRQLPKALREEIDFLRHHAFDPPESEVGRMLAERLGRKEDDLKPWSDLEILALGYVEAMLEAEARKAEPAKLNRRQRRAAARQR